MISVIIPAAGQGKRFGAGKNKAFVLLAGKTILERTYLKLVRQLLSLLLMRWMISPPRQDFIQKLKP